MPRRRSVDICLRSTVAEMVKLFLLPPLLTFALVASTLLVFTSYLTERSLRTTFVVEEARHAGGPVSGWAPVGGALAAPVPR